MVYRAGSLPANANNSSLMYNVLASALTDAGFTQVHSGTDTTRTVVYWKSPLGSHSFSKVWYLGVSYLTSGAGVVRLTVFEDLTVAKIAKRAIWGASTSGTTFPRATARPDLGSLNHDIDLPLNIGAGGNAGTVGLSSDGSLKLTGDNASIGYYISATADRIVLYDSIYKTMVYLGLYRPSDEMLALAAPYEVFPLVGSYGTSSSMAAVLFSRSIPFIAAGTGGISMVSNGGTSTYIIGDNIPADASFIIPPKISPIYLLQQASGFGTAIPIPTGFLGSFIDLYQGVTLATVVTGDTVTSGTDTYTILKPGSSYFMKQV